MRVLDWLKITIFFGEISKVLCLGRTIQVLVTLLILMRKFLPSQDRMNCLGTDNQLCLRAKLSGEKSKLMWPWIAITFIWQFEVMSLFLISKAILHSGDCTMAEKYRLVSRLLVFPMTPTNTNHYSQHCMSTVKVKSSGIGEWYHKKPIWKKGKILFEFDWIT